MLLALLLSSAAFATDPRVCGIPKRDKDGSISRSKAAIKEFMSLHPCPSTNKKKGACAGWAIDHVIPLASCGCDSVVNMQWLPNSIKSAAGTNAKDRWERKVYVCPVTTAQLPEQITTED